MDYWFFFQRFCFPFIEVLMSIWLFTGYFKPWPRRIATLMFTLFSTVAFYHAFEGAASCGCFGTVTVRPWLIGVFDVMAVISLVSMDFKKLVDAGPVRWTLLAGILILFIAVIFDTVATRQQNNAIFLTDETVLPKDQSAVIIEPEMLLRKKFLLAQYTDTTLDFTQGHWIVVLYHSDCQNCRQTVPEFERLAARLAKRRSLQKIALIEMPPYANGASQLVVEPCYASLAKLNTSHTWFANTPTIFVLTDGFVDQAYEGQAAADATNKISENIE